MKILSRTESKQWMLNKVNLDMTQQDLGAVFPYQKAYKIMADSGKKTALSRAISNSLNTEKPGLFWITSSGIWPSSENMDLFDGYRAYLGEKRSLQVAPGHEFEAIDILTIQTLVGISLYFFWDFVLIEGTGDLVYKASHDEELEILSKSKDRFEQIVTVLDKLCSS